MSEGQRLFGVLDEAIASGRDVVLVTLIASSGSTPNDAGAQMLVFGDGSIVGTVGGGKVEAQCVEQALATLKTGGTARKSFDLTPRSGMECGGSAEAFFQAFKSRARLLLLGAGHVAQALGRAAELAGLPYVVADDRSEFANRERFPRAVEILVERPDRATRADTADPTTYVVIVTREHVLDQECLEAALRTEAAYIGMIGSRRKVSVLFQRLSEKGLHPESDPRVYAPIGLDLGGKSPGEIAVSVIAEILQVMNERSGRHCREDQGRD